jgi:hypothetical protein
LGDNHYLEEFRDLVKNWSRWGTVERGEAVVRVLYSGISMRRLAKLVGCSEGLIRHYEIIGLLSDEWKQALREGRYSAREIVAAVRAAAMRTRSDE